MQSIALKGFYDILILKRRIMEWNKKYGEPKKEKKTKVSFCGSCLFWHYGGTIKQVDRIS